MADLPTGTITFLLTDIEGSTALWERDPEAMRQALARHDAILTDGIERHGGVVVKSHGEGDSHFAVFSRASDAMAASYHLQRTLLVEAWPMTTPLRVRMALHTGEAELREGDYYGAAVNRCARLRAAGHGGQILLSQATYDLIRDAPPAGIGLYDLGEHRLKDLTRPERVWQVVGPDLPSDLPRLRTLDARPYNLPLQRDPLIGRNREVVEAQRILLRDDVGLLTLTGPGGTGKTRLALQVAADVVDQFSDGVFFVALAPISDPGAVALAIAEALGVREVGTRPLVESLQDSLREKRLLLVLDNFEQILSAAPLVTGLLAVSPGLKVLVTSRAALQVRGEHEFPVPPLALPDPKRLPPVEGLSRYAAVILFVERATAIKPDFAVTNENAPAVAEICVRLDGLPLAIELAAARSRFFPPQVMLARLERRLPLLTGGARDLPRRQQTLRDAIAWSHDLLDPAEQQLFQRMSVFVGGCTLPAAKAVVSGQREPTATPGPHQLPALEGEVIDLVESLVSQSLLQQQDGTDGEPRFTMLETIREYALERLAESGEQAALQRRHASVFLAFSERAKREVSGPEQGTWLARLAAEHDNLRAAFHTWETQRDTERALRLAAALREFWIVRGHLTEGRERVARVVRLAAATERPELRARALPIEANLAFNQNDYAAARAMYEESLALLRTLGETVGVPGLLVDLAATAVQQGEFDAARAYLEESLTVAREIGDMVNVSRSVNDLANLAHEQGDYALARSLYEEALAMGRQHDDTLGVVTVLNNLAVVARDQGDMVTARTLLEESLAVRKEIGDRRGVALTLANLADVASQQGDYDRAHALLTEGVDVQQELGAAPGIAFVLERFAGLAAAQAQAARALRLAGAAAALRVAVGAVAPPAAQALLEQRLSSARQALSPEAAALAWSEGQALSLDEAVAYALAASGDP